MTTDQYEVLQFGAKIDHRRTRNLQPMRCARCLEPLAEVRISSLWLDGANGEEIELVTCSDECDEALRAGIEALRGAARWN